MESRVGRTLAVVISSMALVGCTASLGFLRDSVTQVQVRQPNFRIVKTGLTATVDTGKALCLFPTDDAQVYRRLMENLHASAKLRRNQMLVNLREDIKWTAYFVFYCSEEHTLSADVIEFMPETAVALPLPLPSSPARPAVPSALPIDADEATGQAPAADADTQAQAPRAAPQNSPTAPLPPKR
jgi:hypothetical protein